MRNAIRKGVEKMNFGMDKFMPDTLVLAAALTIVTFFVGIFAADQTPWQMVLHWGEGFWGLLSFSMQMFLAIAAGYVAASSPPGRALLRRVARAPKTPLGAILFSCYFLAIVSWFNWAMGTIIAAFLAREIAANHEKLDFKLLIAVGYCVSLCIGILGPSTPEFLLSADPTSYMAEYLSEPVPLFDTMFDPGLVASEILVFFIAIPFLCWLIHPPKDQVPTVDQAIRDRFRAQDEAVDELRKNRKPKKEMTFAERCDSSPILIWILCVPMILYIVYWFVTRGFDLDLNIVNFIVLMLGFLLHGTPASLNLAFQEGARSAYGVALQFPLYAGIQGMISGSGLITIIAEGFASISTTATFAHWTFLVGVILNIFVPSSGGLFAVAGPSLVTAGSLIDVPANQTIIAFTTGEVISNMIQPFWAIPLLGIAGLKMKDIVGYCILFFIVSVVLCNLCFIIFW